MMLIIVTLLSLITGAYLANIERKKFIEQKLASFDAYREDLSKLNIRLETLLNNGYSDPERQTTFDHSQLVRDKFLSSYELYNRYISFLEINKSHLYKPAEALIYKSAEALIHSHSGNQLISVEAVRKPRPKQTGKDIDSILLSHGKHEATMDAGYKNTNEILNNFIYKCLAA